MHCDLGDSLFAWLLGSRVGKIEQTKLQLDDCDVPAGVVHPFARQPPALIERGAKRFRGVCLLPASQLKVSHVAADIVERDAVADLNRTASKNDTPELHGFPILDEGIWLFALDCVGFRQGGVDLGCVTSLGDFRV